MKKKNVSDRSYYVYTYWKEWIEYYKPYIYDTRVRQPQNQQKRRKKGIHEHGSGV